MLRYPHATRSNFNAFMIRHRTIWLVAIGLWLIGCALHCYLYVVTQFQALPQIQVTRQAGRSNC